MSETKTPWTPGNWTVRETSSDGFCVGSDYDFPNSIGGSYRLYVAQFMKEPDAKLLAAAPAMAEALEELLAGWKYIRMHHGDLFGVGWDRAQSKAEAALALSRGEKP